MKCNFPLNVIYKFNKGSVVIEIFLFYTFQHFGLIDCHARPTYVLFSCENQYCVS
jgi:hypothetical protein